MSLENIKEQIEFYFSDANYSKDKFLQDTAAQNNKCVPISVILTFTRMKRFNTTVEEVKDAVKDSVVVEVVDDMLKKCETKEYLEYRSDAELSKRVVYMKGFETDLTLDDLKNFLKPHCAPIKITMRRDSNKKFKGSCFVEFKTQEEAAKALELKIEAKKEVEDDTAPKKAKTEVVYIEIKSKDDYINSKKSEKKDGKDDNFALKVKNDFIPKLYHFNSENELQITAIKEIVPDVAFVDIEKKVIRMKFREEWEENTFENKSGKLTLTKMSEEEATEYVKSINIKKVPKRK